MAAQFVVGEQDQQTHLNSASIAVGLGVAVDHNCRRELAITPRKWHNMFGVLPGGYTSQREQRLRNLWHRGRTSTGTLRCSRRNRIVRQMLHHCPRTPREWCLWRCRWYQHYPVLVSVQVHLHLHMHSMSDNVKIKAVITITRTVVITIELARVAIAIYGSVVAVCARAVATSTLTPSVHTRNVSIVP